MCVREKVTLLNSESVMRSFSYLGSWWSTRIKTMHGCKRESKEEGALFIQRRVDIMLTWQNHKRTHPPFTHLTPKCYNLQPILQIYKFIYPASVFVYKDKKWKCFFFFSYLFLKQMSCFLFQACAWESHPDFPGIFLQFCEVVYLVNTAINPIHMCASYLCAERIV